MGTRAAILVKVGRKYHGIFCICDGYCQKPGAGWTLANFHNDFAKAINVVSLGAIDAIHKHFTPDPSKVHSREHRQEDVTIVWGRDCHSDDELTITKVGKMHEVLEYINDYAHFYVFRNGHWYHNNRKMLVPDN